MIESPVDAEGYIYSGTESFSDPDGASLTDIFGNDTAFDPQRLINKLSAQQRVTIVHAPPRELTIEPHQPPLGQFYPIPTRRPKFLLGNIDVTDGTHLHCSFAEWASRPKFGVGHLRFTIEGAWMTPPRL